MTSKARKCEQMILCTSLFQKKVILFIYIFEINTEYYTHNSIPCIMHNAEHLKSSCLIQYEKIKKFISTARSEGATILYGGGRPQVSILNHIACFWFLSH
jgi:hypothetical protein